ncbi:hypothetical protein GQ43DRAFT_253474 [Delitschia confertaspora ATCC 74209]|uniref:Uncharacterized protein n=1 Tax=Delitschia confertaspora ATCC 74209 TaxID=1513339 RepID=A0A9P4MV05_9PLEO|nr:hypothetical protein GQ43DRAFT_253474 [Delitschia confertaspora ATCC 74209]
MLLIYIDILCSFYLNCFKGIFYVSFLRISYLFSAFYIHFQSIELYTNCSFSHIADKPLPGTHPLQNKKRRILILDILLGHLCLPQLPLRADTCSTPKAASRFRWPCQLLIKYNETAPAPPAAPSKTRISGAKLLEAYQHLTERAKSPRSWWNEPCARHEKDRYRRPSNWPRIEFHLSRT